MLQILKNPQKLFRVPSDKALKAFIFVVIALLLVSQRLAIPGLGSQLPASLFITYLFLIILSLAFQVTINLPRLILFIVSTSLLTCGMLFNAGRCSFFSFPYLLMTYLPFVFVLKNRNENIYKNTLYYFQILMVIASVLGICQIALQFVGVMIEDPYSFLPDGFIQQGYATTYKLYYGVNKYVSKSNAFIFLEPSFFSQFASIAFLIEAVYFKKLWRMLIYLVALIISLSGTGIMLLCFGMLIIPALRSKASIIIGILLLCAIVVIFPDYFSKLLFGRLPEFITRDSSAHQRFIAPYLVVIDVIKDFPSAILFGIGPGTVDKLQTQYIASFTPIPKVILEYGVLAGCSFVYFVLFCFFYKSRYSRLSLVLIFCYLFLSGSLLQPQTVHLFYLLSIMSPKIIPPFEKKTSSRIHEYGQPQQLEMAIGESGNILGAKPGHL